MSKQGNIQSAIVLSKASVASELSYHIGIEAAAPDWMILSNEFFLFSQMLARHMGSELETAYAVGICTLAKGASIMSKSLKDGAKASVAESPLLESMIRRFQMLTDELSKIHDDLQEQ